jgi:hypothetical protein
MEDRIEINVLGTQKAMDGLKLRAGSVRRGARLAMSGTTLRILSRVKTSFGEPGKPQRRTGHLSRSMIRLVTDEQGGAVVVGIVGSTMPYKTGYAAILEKGGPIPEIRPKKGKYLKFPRATGMAGIAHQAVLQAGGTYKQAARAAIRVHRRSGTSPFVFVKSVPARYQRAMPYLHPAFDAERPDIEATFTAAIRKALGQEEISSGLGEG